MATRDRIYPPASTLERRMVAVLKEAQGRFDNELLDDEERMLLLDRIKRLRRGIAAVIEENHI